MNTVLQSNGQSSLIQLTNVVKTFQTKAGPFTALHNIDLQIMPSEFIAIIGKSGSGKSTLINMLTGIDRPTSGEIYVDATPVHRLKENQLAQWRGKTIGIVFQFFQLLPALTLRENVMLPMDFCAMYSRSERPEKAMELLNAVQLAEQADKLPTAVSGGQQQRAAIARALANDPKLIVADEPTGNLDSKTAERVFAMFEELIRRGKTIVMVTHDEQLAQRASRIIEISDGQIVNSGTTKAYMTQEAVNV